MTDQRTSPPTAPAPRTAPLRDFSAGRHRVPGDEEQRVAVNARPGRPARDRSARTTDSRPRRDVRARLGVAVRHAAASRPRRLRGASSPPWPRRSSPASGSGRARTITTPAAPSSPARRPSRPRRVPAAGPSSRAGAAGPDANDAKAEPRRPRGRPGRPRRRHHRCSEISTSTWYVLAGPWRRRRLGRGSATASLATMLRGEGRAAAELLRRRRRRAGQRGTPSFAPPGAEPATVVDCRGTPTPCRARSAIGARRSATGWISAAAVKTLPDEFAAGGQAGEAYVEAVGSSGPGTAADLPAVRRPGGPTRAAGISDRPLRHLAQPVRLLPQPLDGSACTTNDVGLDRLTPDLATAKTAPSFAYIVPDRCHDASETPCAPGQPAGLPACRRCLPAHRRPGDRQLGRLPGRRPHRHHLRPGAADRSGGGRQRLLPYPDLLSEPRPRGRPAAGDPDGRGPDDADDADDADGHDGHHADGHAALRAADPHGDGHYAAALRAADPHGPPPRPRRRPRRPGAVLPRRRPSPWPRA